MDKWDKRFMDMAVQIGGWSSCYQENRHIGAIIVKNKRVIATGYNGAPQGIKSCVDKKEAPSLAFSLRSFLHLFLVFLRRQPRRLQ